MFFPMPGFSKEVCLCEPGIKNKQPFSNVASSKATQIDKALRSEKDQKGVSKCQDVGLAHGRFISAWSCQMRMPSTRIDQQPICQFVHQASVLLLYRWFAISLIIDQIPCCNNPRPY